MTLTAEINGYNLKPKNSSGSGYGSGNGNNKGN